MDKGSVIETLRRHKPELRAAFIVYLRLFGSVARGEESAQSVFLKPALYQGMTSVVPQMHSIRLRGFSP
jgi:hypothetical protein